MELNIIGHTVSLLPCPCTSVTVCQHGTGVYAYPRANTQDGHSCQHTVCMPTHGLHGSVAFSRPTAPTTVLHYNSIALQQYPNILQATKLHPRACQQPRVNSFHRIPCTLAVTDCFNLTHGITEASGLPD